MNQTIFNLFFSLSKYPFITKSALFLSYPVAYILPILLCVGIILFYKKKMFGFSLLFLAGMGAWFLARILKMIFHTARPFVDMAITPLAYESSSGFPSEHMAVFTGLAVVSYFLNKKLGIILGVIAMLIGLSRIVIGVHYPIDIIGGAIVGGIVGYLFIKLFKKI